MPRIWSALGAGGVPCYTVFASCIFANLCQQGLQKGRARAVRTEFVAG